MPQFDLLNYLFIIIIFFIFFLFFYIFLICFIIPFFWSRFYFLIIRNKSNNLFYFINKIKIIYLNNLYKVFIQYNFYIINIFKKQIFIYLKNLFILNFEIFMLMFNTSVIIK